MYSNPPVHGARIVANVVGNPDLFSEWKEEMEMMAGRIKSVRQLLYDNIIAKDKSGKDWSFILKQIGMFSFTGLNKAQVNIYPRFQVFCSFEVMVECTKLAPFMKKLTNLCNTHFTHFFNQSDNMTNKWHVYMTKDGRISLAGLSAAKCEYLADAIIDSYYNVS